MSTGMHLLELVKRHPRRPAQQVPDWMMGLWRRHIIAFADGSSDVDTQVFWLQSRNFSIDLRLPRADALVTGDAPWASRSSAQLQVLANHEGWVAQSRWDGEQLRWTDSTALQLEDRWPEPAPLRRVGNCMIEFAPSGAYVEDWRLQPSAPGPLVGLRLIDERELDTGRVLHRGGGLIVSGGHAGLVLGRAAPPAGIGSLCEQVLAAQGDEVLLAQLMGFETSIAHGSPEECFTVSRSTLPHRSGEALCPLDGFCMEEDGTLRQDLERSGRRTRRRFTVDTLEPQCTWPLATRQDPAADRWMQQHAATLRRHLANLY